jgi:thiamine-phosphate pyrophosphorylase
MAQDERRCRLCLVTPADRSAAESERMVAAALSGGDVGALIITAHAGADGDPEQLQALAEAVVPIAVRRGVAALIHNDTRIAGRVRADGVHVDSGAAEVTAAIAAARGKRMVGAGGIRSRHEAMLNADAEPDYLFFGLLDGDREAEIFPKTLELAGWWAEVAVIPAVVMGGASLASLDSAVDARVDFVALRRAVWDDPRGPDAAVADANARLALRREVPA